ncbi:DUF4870 domain-containing protein [Paludibacterium paludis]|uniref:Zinc-ribbon domain-containing protein n=1 Tax=Paludibacterium paludis TaxID=1225769 RepID=A0A918P3P5_9NEIS|nr:zinc ribbon domain-containing protein [Paludibacterium paludis]GGY16974.1 hypothetical protein GCM10011289_20560 [Paludibacterium paludis]
MYCPDCGTQASEHDRFCKHCGKALGLEHDRPPLGRLVVDHTALAVVAHLLGIFIPVLGALVILIAQNRDQDPRAAGNIREAINFQLTAVLVGIGVAIGGFIFAVMTLGLGLVLVGLVWWLLGIVYLVLCVIGAVKCATGEDYRYPVCLRILR